jgi:hypothetical protein
VAGVAAVQQRPSHFGPKLDQSFLSFFTVTLIRRGRERGLANGNITKAINVKVVGGGNV